MTILRSLDRNLSCRCLRDLLVQTTQGGPLDPALPHTFETEALLEAARVAVDSPTVSDDGRLRVLARSAEAHLLCDRETDGRALLERGLSASRTNQERAQFLLRIGHHVHDRRGELITAREKLRLAFTLSERSRRLRTEILLRLGSVERRLGREEAARRSLEAALDLHIRSLEPHVLLELAELAAGQGDLTQGERLIERGHARFEGEANWLGMLVAQARLGVLLRRRGDAREATRVLG